MGITGYGREDGGVTVGNLSAQAGGVTCFRGTCGGRRTGCTAAVVRAYGGRLNTRMAAVARWPRALKDRSLTA